MAVSSKNIIRLMFRRKMEAGGNSVRLMNLFGFLSMMTMENLSQGKDH